MKVLSAAALRKEARDWLSVHTAKRLAENRAVGKPWAFLLPPSLQLTSPPARNSITCRQDRATMMALGLWEALEKKDLNSPKHRRQEVEMSPPEHWAWEGEVHWAVRKTVVSKPQRHQDTRGQDPGE